MKRRFRTWMFDNRRLIRSAFLIPFLLVVGCAGRGNHDLLESELRKQEGIIRQYERETARLKNELSVTQREIDLMRAEQVAQGQTFSAEESVRSLARVKGLTFNTLLTAGQNHDDHPGDERFHAVFYPHDAQGDVVKLSGHLEFEAIDLSRPGEKKLIGRWEYPPEQARELWFNGFLASGYQIEQFWKSPPAGSRILFVAKLTTTDGRTFETTHTIPIEAGKPAQHSPALLPDSPMKSIEQVQAEEAGETRLVPALEPEAWENMSAPLSSSSPRDSIPGKTSLKPANSIPPTRLPSAPVSGKAGLPPPFPDGLKTSDNWTEETIPVVR